MHDFFFFNFLLLLCAKTNTFLIGANYMAIQILFSASIKYVFIVLSVIALFSFPGAL